MAEEALLVQAGAWGLRDSILALNSAARCIARAEAEKDGGNMLFREIYEHFASVITSEFSVEGAVDRVTSAKNTLKPLTLSPGI